VNVLAQAQSVLSPAAGAVATIASLGWVLMLGAGVIFIGVMGLLAWAVSRRARRRPVRPWVWIAGGGLLFPLAVLTSLFD
jgi:cytochrome c oxidase subunit 2